MELKEIRKKHSKFYKVFGFLGYDMCNGGFPTYAKKGKKYAYRLDSLTEQEIDKLMTKSEETGIDYLYEAVKHDPAILPPGCLS